LTFKNGLTILKPLRDECIKLVIMTANDHYAGLGPGTVNIFRNMLGLSEAKWEEKREEEGQQKHFESYHTNDSKQRKFSDFLS
jgi:hypothetical protein